MNELEPLIGSQSIINDGIFYIPRVLERTARLFVAKKTDEANEKKYDTKFLG